MNKEYNRMIDHTYLKADTNQTIMNKLIKEAKEFNFKTVCVPSAWVAYCKEQLQGTEVGITTVVGFPLGNSISSVKAFEAAEAIRAGADEIDMVINIGKLKDKDYDYVLNDIKTVKAACGSHILKVIVETALLSDEEITEVSKIVKKSGAEFIKTSTGFSTRGANLNDIVLMKKVAGDEMLIKAAGGISTMQDMIDMFNAGATRFGTSRSVSILTNTEAEKGAY
ncbi:deoxyribose-phosphate aldolase [Mycoplasmopsis gallinarum]|uniref:Deoxyribose-phosphate aldolase n=1 Tax=Mycoplasmopsis gallinarum TaxID=29557 RepID=A0A168RRC8_9BACT|nr:deoxyribose-phosphate aldolase [Mycoplasmopsis gallinarum]OAB49212.1 Deoxyribose-phosphate aldolase [Mycoplasmopsis gallinarum]